MAIDKITPRFLVSDEDERLLQAGAMTDALNVTISEDGEGSEGVIKNVKGTLPGTAVSGSELAPTDAVTVIGQLSDPQRGKIYFFVADDLGSSQDAIYQYETSSDTYKLVLKNPSLSFNKDSFIKADILNADFNQDGDVETALYFTDNINPPRKINVDRALDGDYNEVNASIFDRAISCVKTANNKYPLVRFSTDTNVVQNNFAEDTFQFATQNIFKDGEESALSPYSALAISKVVFLNTMETDGYAVSPFIDNVCLVDLQADKDLVDLKEVRLLARRGNSGGFFVVDQFDPKSNISRQLAGASVTVYDESTGIYKFYNSTLGSFVDPQAVNKAYDNVPLLAKGQTIAGNRLMFSSYTEGRENLNTNVTIDVKYSNLVDKDENFIPSTIPSTFVSQAGGTSVNVAVDLLAGTSFNTLQAGAATENTIVPAGTAIDISFDWGGADRNFVATSGITDGGVFRLTGTLDGYQGSSTDPFGEFFAFNVEVKSSDSVSFSYFNGTTSNFAQGISLSYTVPQDQTLAQIATALQEELTGKTLEYVYTVDVDLAPVSPVNSLVPAGWQGVNMDGKVVVTWDFSDSTDFAAGAGFTINPKVTKVAVAGSGADAANPIAIALSTYTLSYNTSGFQEGDVLGELSEIGVMSYLAQFDSPETSYVSNVEATAQVIQAKPTFKSGSTHSFGIVYYDKFNRSGFVNELGSCYVKSINERINSSPSITKLGAASVEIAFFHNPPDWAERYQIVYAGSDSMDSYIQYTTGPAFVATTNISINSNDPHYTDSENKRIYVSLNNLEDYRLEKNVTRNYSFTKGDKLRLISRRSDDNSATSYPVATTDGSQIEFEVLGVETFAHSTATTTTPVQIVRKSDHDAISVTDDEEVHEGTFLVLEASRINGGEADVRYVGFDWGDVSAYNLTTGASNIEGENNINHWGKETFVEIYTPKKTVSEKIYYEIGHGARCGIQRGPNLNQHGAPITLTNGDSWLRPVACKTALHADDLDADVKSSISTTPTSWETRYRYDLYGYKTLFIETDNLSDRFESKNWSKGRPHVPFKKSTEIRRRNGITYSDAYAENVANLSLSSFNPSLANFDSLDSNFGAINYIGNYNNDLVAIQENKFGLVPVGKNIIEYAEGSGNVAISANVLGQVRYSSGDFGCGNHPEAVLIQDNDVFFVDESRQKVLRLGGGQLTPISDQGMSSAFEDFFKAGYTKYVSGFDPRINTYFITGKNGSTGETIGYDVNRGVWQSKYSFVPDIYANQDNMLYSALYNTNGNAFYRHDDNSATPTNRNMFHEASVVNSVVEVVSKISPSRVKVFNAVSYEGDSRSWRMSQAVTDMGQLSGVIFDSYVPGEPSFKKLENGFYSEMPRDTSSLSESNKMYLGTLTLVSTVGSVSTYSSNVRLNRLSIPVGTGIPSPTYTIEKAGVDHSVKVVSVSGNLIEIQPINSPVNFSGGIRYLDLGDLEGDPIRGHWAKLKFTNSYSSNKNELYCINTHVTDSKSHHPLGQQ